jgi:hypothetical protein
VFKYRTRHPDISVLEVSPLAAKSRLAILALVVCLWGGQNDIFSGWATNFSFTAPRVRELVDLAYQEHSLGFLPKESSVS